MESSTETALVGFEPAPGFVEEGLRVRDGRAQGGVLNLALAGPSAKRTLGAHLYGDLIFASRANSIPSM